MTGPRARRPEGGLGVTPIMADGLIERREQPLMGGRKNDQAAAGFELIGRQGQLGAIVGDVLEHVHVENGVEAIMLVQIRQRADSQMRQQSGNSPAEAAEYSRSASEASGSRQTQRSESPSQSTRVVPPFPRPPRAPRGRDSGSRRLWT